MKTGEKSKLEVLKVDVLSERLFFVCRVLLLCFLFYLFFFACFCVCVSKQQTYALYSS